VITETLRALEDVAALSDSIVVAYSDGKDSRVVMDLCVRTFKRVEAFFMYLVPSLECIEAGLEEARQRWGVQIRQYPHWIVRRFIEYSVFCDPKLGRDDMPEYKLHDIYALAMADTGSRLLATGAKKSDSAWRRRFMSVKYADQITPIADWNKYDVLSYLKVRGIPVPVSNNKKSATGIDLTPESLIWLHDTFPRDFARVCECFPYAESVIWQRHFYAA